MFNNPIKFDNNQGIGGFEDGGYDKYAIHPTDINWTRLSKFQAPNNPKLLWKVSMDNAYIDDSVVNGGFVIDRDNNILISDCDNNIVGDHCGRLIKINNKGKSTIIFRTNMRLKSPVLGTNGLIYLTTIESTNASKLYCLSSNGNINWEFALNDEPYSKPVIDKYGNIYIFTYENCIGALYCISNYGTLKWKNKFDSVNWYDPIISKKGLIYLGLNVHKTLCAFDREGTKVWEKKLGQGLGSYPFIIKDDGSIYACLSDKLLALDENGNIKWEYEPLDDSVVTSPAIDNFGNLYLNLNDFKLVSLDNFGQERWVTQIEGAVTMPPIVDKSNNIIQPSFMQNYPYYKSWIEVFSKNGEKNWSFEMDGTIISCVLGDDGLIYLLTNCHKHRKKGWHEKMIVKWELYAIIQD